MFGRITPWKVILWLIRFLFFTLVACIVVFLGWRMVTHNSDPKEMKVLIADKALADAFETYGEDLELFTQEQGTYTRAERNNGYFFIRQAMFIPQAEQVQILFRYNNSTIKALTEDYGLTSLPDRGEHLYDLSIVVKKDLTPDIKEDYNEEGCYTLERYHPDLEISGERALYNYRKAVFNGIAVDETTLAVFVDIYYVGDIQYEEPAYGTLCIWDFESYDLPRKLTGDDIAALTATNK
ncbi:MAG: hypothetical protein IJW99_03440 [Clostridia bacterium]|nr:hypothetical protein [Clostridia bacterium]